MQDSELGILSPGVQREQRTAGGLILPTTRDPTKVLATIEKVRDRLKELAGDLMTTSAGLEIPAAPNKVMIVTGKKPYVPTDIKEVIKYANKSEGVPAKRSGSEMALAEFDLPLFLSKEVKKKLGNDFQANPYLAEVATNIEKLPHFRSARPSSDKGRYSSEVLQRSTIQTGYYDITQGKRVERTVIKPGPLETAAIVMTKLLQEPSFHNELGNRVIVCLSKLMKNYRTETKSGLELPEMPDLVHSIAESISILSTRNESRLQLYDILSQIRISPALAAEVIEKMDKHKDLDHPLAYKLTLIIAEKDPYHPWIKTQGERRSRLLTQLNGSSQDLFDMYGELKRQSGGLVFSGDIIHPLDGKVGMEIEYGLKQNTAVNEQLLHKDWANGRGGDNGEIRRSSNALKYDGAYRRSLIDLTEWLRDEATHISSLHIHYDMLKHPHKPDLGNLYQSVGRGITLRKNELDTWEIRGMLPPLFRGSLQPARISDVVELYLHATTEVKGYATPKITVHEGDKPPIDRLIFGYVAGCIPSSEGRLALLMALHTPFMMQGVNPFAFVSSYDRGSIPAILAAAKNAHIDGDTRSPFIHLLEIAYATNFGEGWLPVNRSVDESQEQAFIRNVMESSSPLNSARKVTEMYFVTQIEDKLRAGQQLTNTDLNFLYEVNKKDHPYERNPRIKAIRSRRNLEEDMAIIFGCSQDQIAHRASEINENTRAYVGPLERDIFLRLPEQVNHIYTSFPEGEEIQRDKLAIGGMPKSDLEGAVTTGRFHTDSYALNMMRNRDFTTLQNPETIDTVQLKVGDFGFTDYPTTDELFKRAQSFGLELCPAETGPHLRLKDTNQPLNKLYCIAIKPFINSDGNPRVFELEYNGDGLWLFGSWTGHYWNFNIRWVFRVRK